MKAWALRRWPGHLLVLALLGAAIALGLWQYGSGQAQRDAATLDLTQTEPRPLSTILGPDDPFPAPSVGQPVTVRGIWVSEATVYVERDSGYWVVTPLALDGDAAAALPVVRGVSPEPVAEPVDGEAELTGWLQPPESTGALDPDPTDDVLVQLRTADLVQRVDQDLYSAYVVAQDPTSGLASATLEQLPDAGRFTGLRNFFYALEWWVFGGFAVFVWVRYLLDARRELPRRVEP